MASYLIRVVVVPVMFFSSKTNDSAPYVRWVRHCKLPLRVLPPGNNTWSNQAEVFGVIRDLLKNPPGVPIGLIGRTIIAPSENVITAMRLTFYQTTNLYSWYHITIYILDIHIYIYIICLIYGGLLPCEVIVYWRSLSDIMINDHTQYRRSEMIAFAEVSFGVYTFYWRLYI